MEGKKNKEQWLETAVSGIRFKPDREKVAEELWGHLEDKVDDLQRLFHLSREEAEEMALKQMGNAEEIGKEMAKIHKPWWGYAWYVSRAAVIVLLAVSVFYLGDYCAAGFERWAEQPLTYSEYLYECYFSGKDPFTEENPFVEPGKNESGIVRTPVLVSEGGQSVLCGGYRFKMGCNALWSFFCGSEPDEDWKLYSELEVTGLPWEPVHPDAIWQISATDSLGNYYYSSEEIYHQNVDRGEGGYVMVNLKDTGFLTRTFYLEVIDIVPGAEWIRLEFARSGGAWELTIPLKEVAS